MPESKTTANAKIHRRLLQGKDDLPTKLPSIPTQNEVRDSDLPPQW
jgi:hypothetical protein